MAQVVTVATKSANQLVDAMNEMTDRTEDGITAFIELNALLVGRGLLGAGLLALRRSENLRRQRDARANRRRNLRLKGWR
jgi:predicted DNA-binding ArsR family transcriptional regulator